MPAEMTADGERFAISGCILLGVGALGLLIWWLLQETVVVPRLEKQVLTVAVVQPRPPPLPPPPHKVIRTPVAKVPPTAAPRPQQAPPRPKAEPAPRSPLPAQRNALAMDTPPALDPFEIPQGLDSGDVIGGGGSGGRGFTIGGGGGGGGGDCGRLYALGYLEKLNYEVVRRFRDDPTINSHEFIARVRLWFDSTGGVRQTEFEDSTGNGSLDAVVAALLRTINIKENVPECIQPLTVQVVSPSDARSGKDGGAQANPGTQSSQTVIWRRRRPQ